MQQPLSDLLNVPKVLGPAQGPFAWRWNGVPVEVILVALFTLGIGVARVILQKILYVPLARLAGPGRLKANNYVKFLESCYKWTHYPIAWAWGLNIVLTHGWHHDTTTLWKDLPHSMSFSFYCYFLYQMSFYIYSFIAITCGIDVRRKDFWILVTHHVVTVALMIYAWQWGFFRVGILVLVCLDPGDVFLEFAKSLLYCKLELMAHIMFTLLIIFWIIFRLYYILVLPIRSAAFEARKIVDSQGVQHSWYEEPAFIAMLVIIYVMQIYWFVLIVQVALRAIRDPSSTADVREEDNWNKDKKQK